MEAIHESRLAGAQIETTPVGVTRDTLSYLLPEGRDKEFDSFVSFFEQSRKKWHQRPFIDGFPEHQDYFDGHVGLLAKFRTGGQTYEARFAFALKRDVLEGSRPAFGCGEFEQFGVGALDVDQHRVMLVPIIDLRPEPEDFVAVFVGAYPVENKTVSPLEGVLYRSLLNGAFQTVSVKGPWQRPLFGSSVDSPLEAHPAAIEGRAEIENSVSHVKVEERMHGFEIKDFLTVRTVSEGLAVSLNILVNARYDILDVLLGPAHL